MSIDKYDLEFVILKVSKWHIATIALKMTPIRSSRDVTFSVGKTLQHRRSQALATDSFRFYAAN